MDGRICAIFYNAWRPLRMWKAYSNYSFITDGNVIKYYACNQDLSEIQAVISIQYLINISWNRPRVRQMCLSIPRRLLLAIVSCKKTSFSPDEIYKSIWVRMNFDRHYLLIFLLYSCVDGLSGLLPPPLSLSLSLSLSSRFLSSSSSLSWVKTASTSRAQSGSALRRTEPMLGSRRSRAHTVQTSCRGSPGFWTLFSASPTDLWLPPDSLPEQWSHMSGNHPSNCKSSIPNTKKSLLISD